MVVDESGNSSGEGRSGQEQSSGEPGAAGAANNLGTGADPAAELRAALDATRAKLNETQDLYLRARAETENVRRRSQDDVAKAHKFAVESFAEALVPVYDSLEKALQAPGQAPGGGNAALREGVEITLRQLRSAFERNRLTEINPVGEKFDPHVHQAISMVPADGSLAPNHVVSVLQKGWMIADRVLRPALVTVAQGS